VFACACACLICLPVPVAVAVPDLIRGRGRGRRSVSDLIAAVTVVPCPISSVTVAVPDSEP
jgi:hypothetical protein